MDTIEPQAKVRLTSAEAKAVRAVMREANTGKAVNSLIHDAIRRAKLTAAFPRPRKPNAVSARALRSKSARGDQSFASAKLAIEFLRKRYA